MSRDGVERPNSYLRTLSPVNPHWTQILAIQRFWKVSFARKPLRKSCYLWLTMSPKQGKVLSLGRVPMGAVRSSLIVALGALLNVDQALKKQAKKIFRDEGSERNVARFARYGQGVAHCFCHRQEGHRAVDVIGEALKTGQDREASTKKRLVGRRHYQYSQPKPLARHLNPKAVWFFSLMRWVSS